MGEGPTGLSSMGASPIRRGDWGGAFAAAVLGVTLSLLPEARLLPSFVVLGLSCLRILLGPCQTQPSLGTFCLL